MLINLIRRTWPLLANKAQAAWNVFGNTMGIALHLCSQETCFHAGYVEGYVTGREDEKRAPEGEQTSAAGEPATGVAGPGAPNLSTEDKA